MKLIFIFMVILHMNCDFGLSKNDNPFADTDLRVIPTSLTVNAGEDAVFICGDESPNREPVFWVREGGLPLKPENIPSNGKLEIKQVTVSDSGVYLCQIPRFLHYRGSEVKITLNVHTPACESHQATCDNGQCIPKLAVCNGRSDCADGSDENYCAPTHSKKIWCYFYYKKESDFRNFDVSDIEPSLCTHVIHCYVGIDANSFNIIPKDLYGGQDVIDRMRTMKEKYNHLKTYVGIGGWSEGSQKFSKMASDAKSRTKFITRVLEFLETNKYDGIDLAWDTPTSNDGGRPEDRKNYVKLIQELSEAFKPYDYQLSATIRAGLFSDLNSIYDLVNMNYYLNYIHIAALHYHKTQRGVISSNAPLHGKDENDKHNVEYTIRYILSNGLTPSKIILGLSMEGHTFTLENPTIEDVILGESKRNPGSKEDVMGYNIICYEFSSIPSKWVQNWDEQSSTPYLRDGAKIVSYENPRSIVNKVKLALDYGLGGVSSFYVTTENFADGCKEDTDTYKDFVIRFNAMSEQRLFKEALANLFLAEANNKFYIISENKANLRLPESNFTNHRLLKTMNTAIQLASEEKKVVDEMERIKAQTTKRNDIDSFPCAIKCAVECENFSENYIF